MNQLVCDMCGGTNLIKDGDVFVCQTCGTKYSVETAKRMMITGTVDVSGSTVRVDKEEKLRSLYNIARRARDNNDFKSAAQYYEMALMDDPNNWEAAYYTTYSKVMSGIIAEIANNAVSLSNIQKSIFILIKQSVPIENRMKVVTEVILRNKVAALLLRDAAQKHFDGVDFSIRSQFRDEYQRRVKACEGILVDCASAIENVFSDEPNALATFVPIALDSVLEVKYKDSVQINENDYGIIEKIFRYGVKTPFVESFLYKKREVEQSRLKSYKYTEQERQNEVDHNSGILLTALGAGACILGAVLMVSSGCLGFLIVGIGAYLFVSGFVVRESAKGELEAAKKAVKEQEKELKTVEALINIMELL